jgi:lactoylglutathione lyase
MNQNNEKHEENNSWANCIYAVTLFVEDLVASKQFYQRVFDLPVIFEDNNSAVFKFGDILVNLLKVSAAGKLIEPAIVANQEDSFRSVFTIHVDNVDNMCAKLTARGVKFLNGPMDRPWGIRTASFIDPGGHIWEIAK